MITRRGWCLAVGGVACAVAGGAAGWQLLPGGPRAGGSGGTASGTAHPGTPNAAQAAQQAHAQANCGSLGPGTGLRAGKGWVVSMLPGRHRFRLRGGGRVYLTTARLDELDFDVGRPYYIVLEGAAAGAVLEWQVPGHGWEPVGTTFLYPPTS